MDVVALLNDTTGTQLAVGYKDQNCHVGLILGTGSNACYMEKIANIPKYTGSGDHNTHSHVIINTEYGAFGDDGVIDMLVTNFDEEVEMHIKKDSESKQREQTFEKLISGKYLGAITHAALLKLARDGVLFGETCSDSFKKIAKEGKSDFESTFETAFLSRIDGDNSIAECRNIFHSNFQMEISDDDCETVRKVCEAVSARSARLAATG